MTDTIHLGLPYLDAAQAQKHVTHNHALRMLDALVQLSVTARNVVSTPASPTEGGRWIVGGGATGAFAGNVNNVAAFQDGVWRFFVPQKGWVAYVESESVTVLFDGSAWNELGLSVRNLQNLSELGIGTTADATNVLAAKLNNALFTAKATTEGGTGNLRYRLNKSAAANTVSQLYQDGYSGRAEIGLIGDDNFHIKVSPDGSAWHEAISIDKTTGKPSFPSGLVIPNRNTFTDVSLDGGTSTFGASFARIPLNGVNADSGSNWDNTNHWYTCPRDGVYQITGSLRVGPAGVSSSEAGDQYGIGVYTTEADGPWFLWHSVGMAPSVRSTFAYSRLSYQHAGETLRMFTFSDQGVVVYRAGLQIVLVSDAAP